MSPMGGLKRLIRMPVLTKQKEVIMKIIAKDLELWTLISDLQNIEKDHRLDVINLLDIEKNGRLLAHKLFDKLKEYTKDETIQDN